MRNLIINRLKYTVEAGADKYGADISFKKGLNIIYGPNSVGKTSIITGIIYGLGAEKGLGIFKSLQNPFKPEFYESIDGKAITRSYLNLEISNGDKVISIFRYIKGGDINIVAVKDESDYQYVEKLIIAGEGVFSENGFQNFLFNFLELNQVDLPTYDQKLSKLYFENILPLFFVEQRAGWSQIQARQVTRYNIKDVKKVAFEYLMGLDRFKLHLIELEKKELENLLKKNKDILKEKEENLFILANAEKSENILIVNTKNIGKASIYDYISYLEEKYKSESLTINQLTSQNKDFEDSNLTIRNSLKRLDFEYRKLNERIEKINTELDGYVNYLERIQKNKYKNKQLKKIQELPSELNIKICPICENTLKTSNENECALCHSDVNKKISSPEQNLVFLEDEENTFKKVINQRTLDRRKIIEQVDNLKEKINDYEKQLEHQTKTYAGKEFERLRTKILEVDSIHKDKEKYSRLAVRWEDLKPLRLEIEKQDEKYEELKKEIKNYSQTESDITTLNTIKTNIQDNVRELGLFKSNRGLINNIKLDEQDNYSPYLEDFDIYNISSSSDNIRIILSFYLSLLQTSVKLVQNKKIQFPNLLILDEPKQQNLDNDSLLNCISVIEKIPANETQVILTTYSDIKKDKTRFQKYIIHEMTSSTDYLLKKINADKII
jgi:hypothetical protein